MSSKQQLQSQQSFQVLAKVAVIGDSSVGKTNILLRFINAQYHMNHVATIGIDFKVKTLNLSGFRIKMQIWDTAGQERFQNLTNTIYQGATAIILVYSINDVSSFNNIQKWVKQVKNHTEPGVVLALIANKVDLENQRKVSKEQGQKMAQQINSLFFQTSAKDNINIEEIFKAIALKMKQLHQKQQNQKKKKNLESKNGVSKQNNKLKLNNSPQDHKKKCNC